MDSFVCRGSGERAAYARTPKLGSLGYPVKVQDQRELQLAAGHFCAADNSLTSKHFKCLRGKKQLAKEAGSQGQEAGDG